MINTDDHFHGSDLDCVANYYQLSKTDIVSFGANVNPMGLSPIMRNALEDNVDVIQQYPDRDYSELCQAISRYTSVNPESIVVGNGSTELISLFFQLISPKKALIVEPTYSEYRRDLDMLDCYVEEYILKEENDFKLDIADFVSKLDSSFDLVLLCNPNNPTSTAMTRSQIETILKYCEKNRTYLMVDETYIEFAENYRELTTTYLVEDYPNLIVMRGVSKFFAAPGLRLGYAFCSDYDLVSLLLAKQDPWSINSFAAFCAPYMFEDKDYMAATRNLIQAEQRLITSALCVRPTIKLFKPVANFMLLKLLKPGLTAHEVFEYCLNHGVMIRDCSDFVGLDEHFIRFCIMLPEDNDKLIRTLLEIV